MNGNELIEKLQALTPEQRELPVLVHDGLDPSDNEELNEIDVVDSNPYQKLGIYLFS